ncbi:MAG: HupE/UreJ family protein [Paracoccaceae bacterium]
MTATILRMFAASLCVFVSGVFAAASAHEIRPAIADLYLEQGELRLEIRLNLEAIIAGIEPGLDDTAESANAARYDALRAMPPAALLAAFDEATFANNIYAMLDGTPLPVHVVDVTADPVGDIELLRNAAISLRADLPAGAAVTVGWDASFGPLVLRLLNEGSDYSVFLEPGMVTDALPVNGIVQQSFGAVFGNYIIVGFDHILPKGLDHVLFVIGLFLLSTRLAPLLWQISAFTLAHTITLALGLFGVVQVSPAIVEPLIALSIAYVAIENVIFNKLTRWRPALIFAFGLLHGLGFAGVLQEFGLSEGNEVAGLIGFNIGVELGQITVVALCFIAVGFWFGRKPWYRAAITIPASLAIAVVGLYWFVERAFLA